MYFLKIIQTFYDLLVLEATLNGCICDFLFFYFFTVTLFSLISGEAVLLYHDRPYC